MSGHPAYDMFCSVLQVLWDNKVVEDESLHDKTTQVLHSLNKFIKDDARVEVCMLRIGDGLTICRKL